jgi:Spy/CpxP family protein refolding chaperone
MNRKQLTLLLGALFLGWAANAQSTGNNPTTDTTHTMHHRFQRGAPNANGYAFHRPDQNRPNQNRFGHNQNRFGHNQNRFGHNQNRFAHNRFGHNRFGRGHREFIHYTPEQRKQVMAINKDYRQKREDLFKQDNITLKQYKAGLIALEKEKKSKIEALLTPLQKDQQAAAHRLREDRAQLMASTRLDRLRQALNLTDDQVAKLKTGQDNLRSQAQAIHNNDNLLPQEKREQLKTLMTTRNDSFKTILTPDQYSKFQQMRTHRRGGPGGPGGPWQGRGGFSGKTT